MIRATPRLLACRITFFTRTPCSLCDTAKTVVQNVKTKTPFEYTEIDVMEPGQEKWKGVYEFDTPVIHVEKLGAQHMDTVKEARKLMHRFNEEDVVKLIEEAERA
ncbi:hypothetical protein K504DRAFT_459195, partial [Pleomassaria siparia CBS 279.74]